MSATNLDGIDLSDPAALHDESARGLAPGGQRPEVFPPRLVSARAGVRPLTGLREAKDEAVRLARVELPAPGWLDTHGAAAYLSVTRKQLEHWRSAGGGPPFSRLGRLVRYSRAQLDAWMAGRQVRSTAEVSDRDNEKGPPGEDTLRGQQQGGADLIAGAINAAEQPESYAAAADAATPRYDESIAFLQWAQPTSPWVLVAIKPDDKKIEAMSFMPDQQDRAARALTWLHNVGDWANVHFGVNPVRTRIAKKPRNSDIQEMAWLHVDIDPREGHDLAEEQRKIRAKLEKHEPRPSCVIFSGGGLQAFWRLAQAAPINDNADGLALYNKRLELVLGGDHCHDVSRIMRLPGTVNRPAAKKRAKGRAEAVARVVWQEDTAYDLAKFERAPSRNEKTAAGGRTTVDGDKVERVADLSTLSISDYCRRVIAQGKDPDDATKYPSRSEALHFVCCELVRQKVADAKILGIITDPIWGISASVREKEHAYAVRQVERAHEEVDNDFERRKDGKPRETRVNFRRALAMLEVRVWRDLFSGRDTVEGLAEFDLGPELNDDAERRLRHLLEERFGFDDISKFAFSEFLSDECWLNRRHPVREQFESLPPWDGKPRVERLLPDYFGAADTELHREFGRLHMCAAVQRAYAHGCKYDEVLLTEGPQGSNKSTGIRKLCPREEWYLDDLPLNSTTKELIEQTRGKLFVELAEMNGLRRSEVDRVKAMVSRQSDRARAAYGRRAEEIPRQFVFWGSTNDGEYLRDQTGNRRIWPVTCGQIDVAAIERDRDQLWAEALHLVRQGASIRLDPRYYAMAAEAQAERTVEDPIFRVLSELLMVQDSEDAQPRLLRTDFRVMASDLWFAVGVPVERQSQSAQQFGNACHRLGLRRAQMRWLGKRPAFYCFGEEAKMATLGLRGGKLVELIEKDGEVFDLDENGMLKPRIC